MWFRIELSSLAEVSLYIKKCSATVNKSLHWLSCPDSAGCVHIYRVMQCVTWETSIYCHLLIRTALALTVRVRSLISELSFGESMYVLTTPHNMTASHCSRPLFTSTQYLTSLEATLTATLLPHRSTTDKHCQDTTRAAVGPEGAPSCVALRKAPLPIYTHLISCTASAPSHNLQFFPSYKLACPMGTGVQRPERAADNEPSSSTKFKKHSARPPLLLCCWVRSELLHREGTNRASYLRYSFDVRE